MVIVRVQYLGTFCRTITSTHQKPSFGFIRSSHPAGGENLGTTGFSSAVRASYQSLEAKPPPSGGPFKIAEQATQTPKISEGNTNYLLLLLINYFYFRASARLSWARYKPTGF